MNPMETGSCSYAAQEFITQTSARTNVDFLIELAPFFGT